MYKRKLQGADQPSYKRAKKSIMKQAPRRMTMGPRPSLASQALRTGGWVNPSRGGELKFTDKVGAATTLALANTFTTPGANFLLNGTAQGTDATERVGRKILLKSLLIRGSFSLASTSTGGSPLRVLVVFDKQTNAAAFGVTDALLNNEFESPNNLSNRDRFITICDQLVDPVSAGGDYSRQFVVYKKLNLETMCNSGSSGAVGDITSGSMYVLFAQDGQIATTAPTVKWQSRVRFEDV